MNKSEMPSAKFRRYLREEGYEYLYQDTQDPEVYFAVDLEGGVERFIVRSKGEGPHGWSLDLSAGEQLEFCRSEDIMPTHVKLIVSAKAE